MIVIQFCNCRYFYNRYCLFMTKKVCSSYIEKHNFCFLPSEKILFDVDKSPQKQHTRLIAQSCQLSGLLSVR